ncbi:MAG: adenosylmethionine decarboxylase, partial [Bacteroidales bacterium]|nr:adenosylmethionine decarboxylase [Bacteroidales bacterium]
MAALGRHILVEFIGCKSETLNDVALIEESMVTAARKADATVINSTFHHFSPFGVSGVVVIQESHLAIHTWPEYQYAAVDLFTCG